MPEKSISIPKSRFARKSTARGKIRKILRRQAGHRLSQHSRHPGRCKKSRSVGLFTFTYPEHLSAAGWTGALICGSAIFHGYFLGVFHFSLGFAFHTISFHLVTSSDFVLLNVSRHRSRCERVHESHYFYDH